MTGNCGPASPGSNTSGSCSREGGSQFIWTTSRLLLPSRDLLIHGRPEQCRQLSYIAEYTSDIRHIADKSNIVADTLSKPPQLLPPLLVDTKRPGQAEHKPASVKVPSGSLAAAIAAGVSPVTAIPVSDGLLDYVSITANQQGCQETMSLAASSSLWIRPVLIGGVSLLCDWSSGTPRPLVPVPNRQAVFAAIHGLAHPGIRATRGLVATRAVWANMKADVGHWCRDCQQCLRGKSSSQASAAVQPIPVPQQRFSHIHVDLVGPLPVSAAGYSYLFTAIDRSTQWLEAVPLKTMDATSCADALVMAWISHFGVLTTITSDRGAQLSSELWAVYVTVWAFSTPQPRLTTHSPMGWWKEPTAN